MTTRKRFTLVGLLALLGVGGLSACRSDGEIVVDQGVGITAVRSRCPAAGIPNYTGDVTLFRGSGAKIASNIDAVAVMTNVRVQCTEDSSRIFATSTFDVAVRRNDARGARQITIPYFVSVLRGGSAVVSKRVGQVTINFNDGQVRSTANAQGSAYIDAAAATLPEEIRERITRKRRAGDSDAALDPMSDPEVKAALARADFELLVGFQLDEDQLAYNATR